MEIISYLESMGALGFVIGPCVGYLLYSIGGYNFTFIAAGFLNIIASFLVNFIFTPKVDSIE